MLWIGFNWFRTGIMGGLLWTWKWTFGLRRLRLSYYQLLKSISAGVI